MKNLNSKDFYKVSVAVDIVVFTVENNALEVLTIKRADGPYKGMRALPGGFVHPSETSLSRAKEVLREKAGLKKVFMEQLYTFDTPGRDPRGPTISITYFALAPRKNLSPDISQSTQEPTFIPVKQLGKLAFDHKTIVNVAQDRLRGKLEYTNIAFSLLPEKFTFSELQKVYETIFGKLFDKRNFRKKISRLGFVKATKEKIKQGRQRPALLYRATTTRTQKFKNNF